MPGADVDMKRLIPSFAFVIGVAATATTASAQQSGSLRIEFQASPSTCDGTRRPLLVWLVRGGVGLALVVLAASTGERLVAIPALVASFIAFRGCPILGLIERGYQESVRVRDELPLLRFLPEDARARVIRRFVPTSFAHAADAVVGRLSAIYPIESGDRPG